jgi:protein-S-isoprenylcysteine O-methyltransferase Ste14
MGGGLKARNMKQRYLIDSLKAISFLVVLFMMAIYDQWQNTTAWVYLSLHGTYGILWVIKSRIFPDKSWEKEIGWIWICITVVGLCAYWVAPWMLTSRGVQCPPWYLALCIALFTFGVFFHFTTDMQKFTSLALRPQELITTGMMGRIRNLNYFGELLIYLGFALLAMHWIPVVLLLGFVLVYWLPNMHRKDRSLSRYLEFESYRKRTKLFIPFLF